MKMQPFQIQIDQAILDDLQGRLANTRWPHEVEDAGWNDGTNLGYMKELANYWQHEFDWRTQEEILNRFAHFRTEIDGFGLHFIHERGKGPNPLPILLLHGWPDSFYRMVKIINIMIYWATGTIRSSFLPYRQEQGESSTNATQRVETPTGVAIFPKDIVPAPREFGERFFNIQRWTEMPRVGHFAALEEPALLAQELREFFRPLHSAK